MAYIKGLFIQDIFSNQSNGYVVGLLRVKESDDENFKNRVVTFTGMFNELKYKTTYKMNGEFITHPKYGQQFQVESYEIVLPTDEEEIIDFLSSDIFPIGEKTAEKIVKKLGKDAINKIINEEDALSGIPRLSIDKINKIREVLMDYDKTSQIVIELNKLGFSTKNSISIIKKYGSNTLSMIDKNIYVILDDIDITFPELDKIASNYGIELNDERRIEALVIYAINNITFNTGDTYLYFSELYEYIVNHSDKIDKETLEYILLKMVKKEKIVIEDDRYYLKELYDAEHYIAKRLKNLNKLDRRKLPKLEEKIRTLELVNNIYYDESQKNAIMKALNNNITIITGGPGTGKTTIIKCIVKLLLEINGLKQEKLALLAPTGRAARKLMETTGIPSYTIHKYLGWDKESNSFQINEFNPNKQEYIIVDEASMIDTILMMSLLKGITLGAKVILVGDYYQLPSVSQGQILKDLIDSDILDVIKLNCLYRQSEDSYITTLASEIKNREVTENFMLKYDDYNFITCKSDEILFTVKDIVNKAMEHGYQEKDIQVLAPLYKTSAGIDSLNKMLQEVFNPHDNKKNEITSGDIVYREGDKILQLVNDSDNNISNGDIGYIESIISSNKSKSKKNEIIINFDGIRVTYNPKDFINFTHGYAISVHKSQGGEFKMVIIPFAPTYKRMLYNKLIYTAVTRAKEKLILVGEPSSFIYGINNDYIDNRKTTLLELLQK